MDRQDQAEEQSVQTVCTLVHSESSVEGNEQDCQINEHGPHLEWNPSSPRNPKAPYASHHTDLRAPSPYDPTTLGDSVSGSSPSVQRQVLQNPPAVDPLGFRPPSQRSRIGDSLNEHGRDPSGGREEVSEIAELSSFKGGLIGHSVDLAPVISDAPPHASHESVPNTIMYDGAVHCGNTSFCEKVADSARNEGTYGR